MIEQFSFSYGKLETVTKDSAGIRETVASLNSTGREVCNPKVRDCEKNHYV